MKSPLVDWLMIGCAFLFLIVFVAFVQARGTTITGKLLGANVFGSDCESYSGLGAVPVSSSLDLCGNRTHVIGYFLLESPNATIYCHGSTLQGNGGALFVSRVSNAHVTLDHCTLQGYDGLYAQSNPVVVRVDN